MMSAGNIIELRWPSASVLLSLLMAASSVSAQETVAPRPATVFFDWAKREINRDAAAILDQLGEAHRRDPSRRLILAGHADRSGGSAQNLASSRKRAETVRDYLAKLGVPISAMSVRAYGESRPVVPTEDGVREVQNRRVEIWVESPGSR